MIAVEPTGSGLMVTVQCSSATRWVQGGFLGVWLCGWAAGELFALAFLIAGGWAVVKALLAGELAVLFMAIPVGAFLLLWLAGWSLAGVAVGTAFLKSFCHRWTLLLERKSWVLEQKLGPFTSRWMLPAGSVERVLARHRGHLHVAALDQEPVELDVPMGREEVEWLAVLLRGAAGLPLEEPPSLLPAVYRAVPEGDGVLIARPPAAGIWMYRLLASLGRRPPVFAAPNRFEIRRNGSADWAAGPVGRFEVTCEVDSDGDPTWGLDVIGGPGRQTIDSGDVDDLVQLGRHLAWRTGWPLSLPEQYSAVRS